MTVQQRHHHATRRPAVLRLIFAALAIWATVIGPGLCVGGVLQHLCLDCAPVAACDHEDDCAADPCLEPLVPPVVAVASLPLVPTLLILVCYAGLELEPEPGVLAPAGTVSPLRKNLARPESDLPLLI